MFSNSQLEIEAKDELIDINKDVVRINDNYDNTVNQSGIQDSLQNSIKHLNNISNCKIESQQTTERHIKEEQVQNFNQQLNETRKVDTKSIESQKRKLIKQEGLSFLKSIRENKISSSGIKGSIQQRNYSIHDSQVNIIDEIESYYLNSIEIKQNKQGVNNFKKGQSQYINMDDEDDNFSVYLSQIYQKRDKVIQDQQDSEFQNKSRERKQKHIDLQQNVVLNSQNKQLDTIITNDQVRQQQNIIQNKNNLTNKNQQLKVYNESYYIKKSNDMDNYLGGDIFQTKRNIINAINRQKKQSFDFSTTQTTPNKQQTKNLNQYSPIFINSISKENQSSSSQYAINSSNFNSNNILNTSQILSDYNSKREFIKQDPYYQTKEKLNDKVESDYMNFHRKNNHSQNQHIINIKKNNLQAPNIETHLKIHNSILLNPCFKEQFIETKKVFEPQIPIVDPSNQLSDIDIINTLNISDQKNKIDEIKYNINDQKNNNQELKQINIQSQQINVSPIDFLNQQKQISKESKIIDIKVKQRRATSKNEIQQYNNQDSLFYNYPNNIPLVLQIQQAEQEQKYIQTFSAAPSRYKKERELSQNNQYRNNQNVTPLRNNKKSNQNNKRRKSIQILKKFDPNFVNIEAIKIECKQDMISDSVQKFFESKQMNSQKQQYSQNSQILNTLYSPKQVSSTQEQQKDDFNDSSLIFKNQEIFNRLNISDDKINLNNQSLQNQRIAVDGEQITASNQQNLNECKISNNTANTSFQPFKDGNNISIPQQKQSLFYNYLEYKQFKSKLNYEKEMKSREKMRKSKIKNKSPLPGIDQVEELNQTTDKKKGTNTIISIQNISQAEDHSSNNVISGKVDQQYIQKQSFLEVSPQIASKQKKNSLNISTNSIKLSNGQKQLFQRGCYFQEPQTTNILTEKKRIKLNQFSLDNRYAQNIDANSCQNSNQNTHFQQNYINKLPQISKKFLF